MKWWIALLLSMVTLATALPQDVSRTQQVRRTVVHRRAPATQTRGHAGARIAPPVKAPAKRVQAVRVVHAKPTAHVKYPTPVRTAPLPFKTTQPKPVKFQRVPAGGASPQTFPGIRTLTKAESEALQRQINQWQIAVVGGQVQPGYPGAPQQPAAPAPAGPGYPPGQVYPAGPGTIWIQVPAGGYPYPPTFPQPPAPPAPPTAPQAPETPVEEASEGEDAVEETPAGEEVPAPEEAPGTAPAEETGASPPETPAEEGVAPQEEVPATPEEVPATPEEEVPATPEKVPAAPEVEVPATPEEVPATPEETAPGSEEGVAPPAEGGETPEAPATGGGSEVAGGPSPPATGGGGDEQENKLVHCKEARGQFAHESSCSKFYNCWDDVVVESSCPRGLVFSEEHSYCDFPENVDCGERTTEDFSPPIEEHGGCASAYGSYRSQTNCSEFFICDNGVPIMFGCPSGLFYNDELGVCDYPYRVECQNPPAPETPPAEEGGAEAPAPEAPAPEEPQPPPAEAPPAPPAEEAAVPESLRGLPPSFLKAGSPCWHSNVYPLNNACSRVAVCRSGTTSILACPKGMAYDTYKRRCLPYYRARC